MIECSNSFNNNLNSNITFNANIEDTIPSQLSMKLGNSKIIGREKELKEIDNNLNSSNNILLIKEIGGIGKSTIASAYLHRYKEKFKYYGFFEGLDNFFIELKNILNIKSDKESDIVIKILSKLNNLEGEKLLIIDDIKDIKENQEEINSILSLQYCGYKILFTSREDIEDIKVYPLGILNIDDAKALFNSIHKIEDEILLEEILKYLDFHAFFIEKTAKSIKENQSPQMIKEKFETGEFSTINVKRKENFNSLLKQLFSFDKLDNEEILILKQLSVLPSIGIPLKFLERILKKENNIEFEELLEYLCEKGWLSKIEKNYKLHQIIKEYIFSNHMPLFEEIEIVVDYFSEIMQDIYTIEETLSKIEYLEYLNSITQVIKNEKNEKTAYLLHANGYLHFVLGDYKKAEILYKIALTIKENILDEDDISLAISINNNASIYEQNGDYEKALEEYLKSLKIREKYFGEYPDKVAIGYNNVGRMYSKLNMNEQTSYYLNESLKIRKEIFGENHESTARAYNVLGSFFQDISINVVDREESQNMLNKAFELLTKSLTIRLNILSPNHPDIAKSYNNIGVYYSLIEDWDKAINNFNLALDIYQQAEGNHFLSIGLLYFSMGTIYNKQKNFEDAILFKEKALKIWSNILEKNHRNIILVKRELEILLAHKKV